MIRPISRRIKGLYGAQPNWEFLGGTTTQVAAFWNAFHLSYGRVRGRSGPPPHDWLTGAPLTYDVDHENVVYVIRPEPGQSPGWWTQRHGSTGLKYPSSWRSS